MNKKIVKKIILTLIFTLVLFYISLPPINLQSPEFWSFALAVFIFYKIISAVGKLSNLKVEFMSGRLRTPKIKSYSVLGAIAIFLVIILVNIAVSPLFNSKSYAKRITINEDSDFIADVKEVDFSKIPLLDKDSSQKLGDRVMGQMPELVSQFDVSDLYTQINYNNDIIRVTPLEYNGFIKYFTNRGEGVKGYITVNSVTGESTLIKLDKGMHYMPSALFNENLYRKLRFSYPTKIFDDASFEIDNEGNPYWIVPTIKYSGVGRKKEIIGAVIFNPIDGESIYYDVKDVPAWVDHVYNADLILEQVDDWGSYRGGFINSIFGQKNVVTTTDGYNYTVMNDDVYLYTGITSAASDEANVGFILTNMRTKETNYYAVPGAEEYSAMASAEGQVQQMSYESSFPLLINLNNRATYLMSLKDNAGLVKMYAFVDVTDYQKVVVTDASKGIEVASENYLRGVDLTNTNDVKSKKIILNEVTEAVIDNNTYYFIKDNENNKYKVSIKVSENILPFLKKGDEVTIEYQEKKSINEITSIK